MPDVFHTLINHDLEMLKIIAGKWGFSPEATSQADIAREISTRFMDPLEFGKTLEVLPDDCRECLIILSGMGGKLLWSEFLRRYGAIREMGIARRSRETPFETPASVAEVLWYHGLIGKAFLKGEDELQEYAFIPDEIIALLPKGHTPSPGQTVISVDQDTLPVIHLANDRILDHLTSYLAAVRSGRNLEELKNEFKQPTLRECERLLISCGLLDTTANLHPDAVKTFLAEPRAAALCFLFTKWLSSTIYDELRLMPGIITEGIWKNDPLKTRQTLIERINALAGTTWWRIDSFMANIKRTLPYYQRPAGDFESWMIRSEKTGASLRGFEHWDHVDGALIRFLILGPLHWLGFLDLGGTRKGMLPEAFRLSNMANSLIANKPPEGLAIEGGTVTALRNGKITCPREVPRAVRYQLARFCEAGGVNDRGYLYQITADSLKNAANQGLLAEQLTTLLTRHAGGAMPASLVTALQRWAMHGTQLSLKQTILLRVTSPEILIEIRNSPVGRFLGEPLNPTTVILPATAVEKIIPRLMELGYLCEWDEGLLSVLPDKE
jgi:hypothetical protein